jgi:O-antigen ligase
MAKTSLDTAPGPRADPSGTADASAQPEPSVGSASPSTWSRPNQWSRRRRTVLAASAAAVVFLAAAATTVAGADPARVLSVAVAAAVVVGLLVAAVWRFEVFVLALLGLRASIDAVRGAGAEPAVVVGFLLVTGAVLWLARPRQVDGWRGPAAPTWAALALLGTAGASLFGAQDRAAALLDVARLAAAVAMIGVVDRLVRDERVARRVTVAVFASAAAPLALAGYQAAGGTGSRIIDGFSRVRGTFVHPNPLALYLTVLLVFGAGLALALRGRSRLVLVAFLVAGGTVLVATYARGAWIAAFVGILVVAVAARRWWVVGALLVAVAVVGLAVPSTVARFADVGRADRPGGDPSNSLTWRVRYWDRSLDLFTENPVTGVGLGMVAERLPEGVPPHNDYVRALVETGVLGVATYLALFAAFGVTARRALQRAGPGLERGIATGFTGVVVAVALLALTANVLTQVVILWYLAALVGLATWVARRPPPATGD